jgi:type VII secretion integral membrane protein EccD
VADAALLFTAGMTVAFMLCVPAMVAAVGGVPPQHAAAIGLVFTLIVSMFFPMTAFRLGGLTLPLLPGNAKELGEDVDPVPYELVVSRGVATIRYLTALCLGLSAAQVLLAGALLLPGGGWPMLLASTMSLWLFIRARHMGTTPQRWAVLTPAMALAAGSALRWTFDHEFFTRTVVVVPALAVAGALLAVASSTLPGRRLAPYWGRWVEILETLVAIAILPLLGAVLDVYQAMRAWTGG